MCVVENKLKVYEVYRRFYMNCYLGVDPFFGYDVTGDHRRP